MSVGVISTEPQAEPGQDKQIGKVVVSSLIGTTLEYYDFFIYGTAAALVFPKVFFPNLSPLAGILAAYATLALPFFIRPFAGVVFGNLGDTIGRKKMLIVTLIVMGVSTFAVGLVPTYDTIGGWAPLVVITLRIIQGIALSGEWGGAVTMIVEHSPPNRRGLFASFVQLGNAIGLFTSALVFALIPSDSLLNGAWRIPFLISIVALLIGIYIRTQVAESPLFTKLKETGRVAPRAPFLEILRRGKRPVLLAMGTRSGETVLGWLVIGFLLSYATRTVGLPSKVVLYAILMASGLAMITFPLFGALSDRFGRHRIMKFGAWTGAVFAFPFFWLVDSGSVGLFYFAIVFGYAIPLGAQFAIEPSFFSEAFDTSVRYSGISIGYNLGTILGGVTPIIATSLVAMAGGKSWPICVFLMAASLVTVACVSMLRDRAGKSLAEDVLPTGD